MPASGISNDIKTGIMRCSGTPKEQYTTSTITYILFSTLI